MLDSDVAGWSVSMIHGCYTIIKRSAYHTRRKPFDAKIEAERYKSSVDPA